jgi:undecaprenyl diphosphate synthase
MIYPKHVAIIPDGNRTRAKANDKDLPEAYMTSYEKAVELIKYTFTHTDTQVFTLRGLSTENTKNRPKEEFNFLMTMYKLIGDDLDNFLMANKVNFKTIGNMNGITEDFREYLMAKEQRTKCDSDRTLIFALNYGGRDEILRGVKKLQTQNIDFGQITEEQLSEALDL